MEIFEEANANEGPRSLSFIKFLGKSLSMQMLRKGNKYFILQHVMHLRGLLFRTVKGWVSPCLKAKKLIFHSSVDIGKRHEIPGSEIMEYIVHSTERGVSFIYDLIPLTPSPTYTSFYGGDTEGPKWMLNMQQIYMIPGVPTCKHVPLSIVGRYVYYTISKTALCSGVRHTIFKTVF